MLLSIWTQIKKSFAIIFVTAGLLFSQNISLAAVAHDTASESHVGTTGSTNQASFNWTHTPAETPRGVLVFVYTDSATKLATGVTYGGVAMTDVTAAAAVDTANEPGRVDTYFLGASVPTGAQPIVVSRTNNAITMYASAMTQTALVNTEAYQAGIVLLQENGMSPEQSVTDGTPGTNSLRYAGLYTGLNTVPSSAGTNSTFLNSIDLGGNGALTARETTAGQGARPVGFAAATDDRAAVHLAIREIPAAGSVSASPTTCTISSGASTCTAPFTWSISNAVSPNLYNSTTATQYSTSASGTGVSYSVTNGSNTIQVRNGSTVLASTSVTGSCISGTTWNGSGCAAVVVNYNIVASSGANGSVTPGGTTIVAEGGSQTYSITPDSGYDIATLVVDSISIATSTTYTFTNVQAAHTISATFSLLPTPPSTFTIIANQNPNGTVSPSGATIVTSGGSQTYTVTPDTKYNIDTLIIDSFLVATSTSYTFTNVQTNHTIEATFIAIPRPVTTTNPDTGPSRPTTIIFSGKAFPDGKVFILNKELRTESLIGKAITPSADGSFHISFVGILQGLQSFGLIAKDKDERVSQTKFYLVDTRSDSYVEKDILVPPTIDVVNGQVSRGGKAIIFGYASPDHIVQLFIDNALVEEVLSEGDGAYKFEVSTGILDFGQHQVQARQETEVDGKLSDFSTSRTFIVSYLTTVKADLNGDDRVDIKDWSIFLSRWGSKNGLRKIGIDLNNDGKVNIADFSIFIRAIRKN